MATTKKVAGRTKGMNKDLVNAKKHLRTWAELEGEVSSDVLQAYDVIRGVMKNDNAPPASRRAAANDIINFFKEMQERSEKRLEGFYGEDEGSGGNAGNQDSNNVQFLFQEK